MHVVLDNVRSAFNVGSIFRTADAAGIGRLHLCGLCAWPPHPKIEKTSLGAHAYVPWERHETTVEALSKLRAAGVPIVGVEARPDARRLFEMVWPLPVALVFGHEVVGLLDETLDLCDSVVQIPMYGYKNSLNVATAFGIVVYDLVSKVRQAG